MEYLIWMLPATFFIVCVIGMVVCWGTRVPIPKVGYAVYFAFICFLTFVGFSIVQEVYYEVSFERECKRLVTRQGGVVVQDTGVCIGLKNGQVFLVDIE